MVAVPVVEPGRFQTKVVIVGQAGRVQQPDKVGPVDEPYPGLVQFPGLDEGVAQGFVVLPRKVVLARPETT